MSEWTEYDELAKMGDALKELREENQRLREALETYPHDSGANTWFRAQVDWYWKYVAPILGVEPRKP